MEPTYDVPDPTNYRPSNAIAWYIIPRDCGETDYQVAIEMAKARYADGNVGSSQGERLAGSNEQSSLERPSALEHLETATNDLKRAIPIEEMEPRFPGIKHGDSSKPETAFITEWADSLYYNRWWALACRVASSFGAVHMISWNRHFATITEKWLWRSSCVGSIVFALVTMQFKKVEFRW